ncbi:simple sugar transport system permease protein [Natronocella acetinitrilica]|uniref:Simple sugar transport system permease protein n=1 Tax=Natronocella acetinitrilica TaxID=414046 RepID=A0AAE3G153_9GAMM|nr:ABC transporter permease [Natronocella acetinitrilica]MCP1673517.1 simple sugar transport system permease protein [Natronocella acetinitrilica]
MFIRPGGSLEAAILFFSALLFTLFVFGVLVTALGHDPFAVYYTLYLGGFGTWFSLQDTLIQAAPLMLTALCTAIPARAGLLIIGNEGALVLGGVAAVVAGVAMAGAPPLLAVIVILASASLAGALWIGSAGLLKHYRGVNEVIATLLMNYIAIAIMMHLVTGPIRDYAQVLKPSSWSIPFEFMVGTIPGTTVHWGLVIGMVVCLFAFVLMRYTTFGFSADVLGGNNRAAQAVGLPVAKLTLLTCLLGGAAAGLAGGIEIVAVHGYASNSLVVGFGYAGILVAFAARHNPLAIILVAILLGGIAASGGLLQRRFDLPDAATLLFQGLLFMSVLATTTLYGLLGPWLNRKVLRHGNG